ncbi:MAG TPA: PDGLE domain-containing protein, partial [Bryobacteraceae bacterium]|nr:PDGLE domain-containing protein [Bryobacteraceae bacterium]
VVLVFTSVALAAMGFVLASAAPDTLEKMAEQLGIAERETAATSAPMPDYRFAGIESDALARAAAGLSGLAMVFAVTTAASRLLRRRA